VPNLTIITIHLDDPDGLHKTFESLGPTLRSESVEWIVVDGGSDRQSAAVLKAVESLADVFISEPDEGIYDAMNKGTRLAAGE